MTNDDERLRLVHNENVRQDVVQKMIDAHQAEHGWVELLAVELEDEPTDAEHAAAREAVVKSREAELRQRIEEIDRRIQELRERFGRQP